MKKLLLLFALIAAFGTAKAQLPDYGLVPSDLTFTDLDNNSHDINALLDQGYVVILDLYAVWCGPCWDYHEEHTLNDLWTAYGPDGTDELRIFGVEADPSTDASTIGGGGNSIGDWLTVDYPMANDDQIANAFNLAYYPTIITLYPDRSVVESGQATMASHYSTANAGPGWPVNSTDPSMHAYTGLPFACGDMDLTAIMQNRGTSDLTSATIEVKDNGGNVIATENWTGNLTTYQYEMVTIPGVPVTPGDHSIEINMNDDDMSNNSVDADLAEPGYASLDVIIEVTTDYYAGETSWELESSAGTVVASGSYQFGDEDQWGGGGPDATQTHSYNATLDMNECYTMTMWDAFGDGMSYNGGGDDLEWGYKIKGAAGVIISADGDFEDVTMDAMKTDDASSIEETAFGELNMFPNPSNGVTTVMVATEKSENISLTVFNAVGQAVISQNYGQRNPGTQLMTFDASNFESGIYMVRVEAGAESVTKVLSVK